MNNTKIIFMTILSFSLHLHVLASKDTIDSEENFKNKDKLMQRFLVREGAEEISDVLSEPSSVEPGFELRKQTPCAEGKQSISSSFENRFDQIEDKIMNYCENVLKFALLGNQCSKLVADIFDVGSPSCRTGEVGSAASSCTMGIEYLLNEFQENQSEYESAIIKLDELMEDIKNGKREYNEESLFPLLLEATNGDKRIAINLITSENLGFAGLTSFVNQLDNFPERGKALLKSWASSKTASIFDKIKSSFPDKKFRNVPREHIDKVKEGKEYHYWARALMAAGMREKGYSALVSRGIATATSAVYELHYDWNEHVDAGVEFIPRASAAFQDIMLSDCGSELGADVGDPFINPSCIASSN